MLKQKDDTMGLILPCASREHQYPAVQNIKADAEKALMPAADLEVTA